MRLWTLHPRHLDRQGLTGAWREALLAQAVLAGRTRGYRDHPQLLRFREHPDPSGAVGAFLSGLEAEATARGYRFDHSRIDRPCPAPDGAVRIPLNVAPQALDDDALPQHVAFACSDVLALARSARAAGLDR